MARPNPKRIEGQFVPHRADLLASAAWRKLSLAARLVLDRLELEHMAEGGAENGNLACTYDHFEEHGIRRKSVKPALAELVAAGMVEITFKGRGGNAAYRHPSRYRLTYLSAKGRAPTDDWRGKGNVPASVERTPAGPESFAKPN